jgi:DNA-directed RNA polymerase subunit RPC12/RpoP
MYRYSEKDFKEALKYFWKIYDEQHLGMLARHYYDVLCEAVDKASKQEEEFINLPVERKETDAVVGEYIAYDCPNCKREQVLIFPNGDISGAKNNFCPHCGYRLVWIDWGEEVERNV